jgi:hypothetical protein
MNQLHQHGIQRHITILGWLYIVGQALFLVMGGFVFVLLAGIGVASDEAEAIRMFGVVGTAVGILLAVLGVPGLVAGYGLLTRRPWARVLAIVMGVLSLVNFPIGTALGLYTFWVLTQPTATHYFTAAAPA